MKKQLFFFFLSLILTSCQALQCVNLTEESGKKDYCLPNILTEGIHNSDEVKMTIEDDTSLEPAMWVKVYENKANQDDVFYSPILVQKTGHGNRIFIETNSYIGILVFDLETSEMFQLPSNIYPDYGFLDQNQNAWFIVSDDRNNVLTFAKIGTNSNIVEYVSLETDIELGQIVQVVPNKESYWIVSRTEDPRYLIGHFRLEDGKLMSENFALMLEGEPERFITSDDLRDSTLRFRGMIVEEDGNAVFSYSVRDKGVYTFRINTELEKTLINYINYSKLSIDLEHPGPQLFLDRTNRLWIGDYGWINLTENADYYANSAIIYRSPVLVSADINPEAPYVWARPVPTAVTADRRVWYQSIRGTAWFQPETGEWCMFSTSRSKVLEDSDGNLWMVYDNALYMLPASETSKKE